MTTIDFTSVFATANNEAEVNNLMTSLVESVLKAGHARIESFTAKGKRGNKNTKSAKVETKGVKAEKPTSEAKAKTKVERKSSEERIKERIEFIKSCKPGTSVRVTTKNFRTKKDETIVVDVPTKAEIKKLKLKTVDYNEKSFVVMGGTKEISKYLKHILGGTFNSYLECGAGWVFAKNEHGEAVKKALALAM